MSSTARAIATEMIATGTCAGTARRSQWSSDRMHAHEASDVVQPLFPIASASADRHRAGAWRQAAMLDRLSDTFVDGR